MLESDGETCAPAALSVVNKFYPIGHNYSCPILDKIDVSFKANMMYSMMETDVGKALYSFYMSENFENVDPKISMRTRSMIMLGTPLRGFKNSDDRIAEQRKLYVCLFHRNILSHLALCLCRPYCIKHERRRKIANAKVL